MGYYSRGTKARETNGIWGATGKSWQALYCLELVRRRTVIHRRADVNTAAGILNQMQVAWDSPGGPVVSPLCFHGREYGFGPWLGDLDPTCCVVWPKEKKKKRWRGLSVPEFVSGDRPRWVLSWHHCVSGSWMILRLKWAWELWVALVIKEDK